MVGKVAGEWVGREDMFYLGQVEFEVLWEHPSGLGVVRQIQGS